MRFDKMYIILLLGVCGCNPFGFKKLSKDISAAHASGKKTLNPSFHDIRLKLYQAEKIRVRNLVKTDTTFLLEKYLDEEGRFSGKLWNSKDSISFTSMKGNFELTADPFTSYISFLVETWDTMEIREQEGLYSNMIPSRWLYGTRIIIDSNGYSINTIKFLEFFKTERDRAN